MWSIRLLSLLLSEKAPSCYIRPGSCWDHAKQNVLQRNLHHQEQKHTPKRRPNRPLHTCTYIYTFVKMFITIRSTKMFVTIRSTSPTFTRTYKTHDNTTHMCSHRFICFVWRSARLKHLGPSASLSCPRTGPWIWASPVCTRWASGRVAAPALPSFRERRSPAGSRCCRWRACSEATPWSVASGSSLPAARASGRGTLVWFPGHQWKSFQ